MRLSLLAVLMSSAAVMEQFKPEIANVEIGTRTLRAGDSTFLTVKFVNRGTEPSADKYMAFVHLEGVDKKCDDIRGHHDHELETQVSCTQAGLLHCSQILYQLSHQGRLKMVQTQGKK